MSLIFGGSSCSEDLVDSLAWALKGVACNPRMLRILAAIIHGVIVVLILFVAEGLG